MLYCLGTFKFNYLLLENKIYKLMMWGLACGGRAMWKVEALHVLDDVGDFHVHLNGITYLDIGFCS